MFTKRTNPTVPRSRIEAATSQKPPRRPGLEHRQLQTRADRAPMLRRAIAILPHGETLPVVIRDMSSTGLRIHYAGDKPLTGRVLLSEPTTPMHVWADLIWRTKTSAGFRFA